MFENKDIELIDYLILFIRWKKFLISIFFITLVISYLIIFFFIPEQYKAKALIIPTETSQSSGFSSILKNFSSLPLNLGGLSSKNDVDLYTTIIFSRTNLENIVKKFNLLSSFDVENEEEAIKVLKSKIEAEETKEEAFEISVMAETPKKAADMTNYIVDELNKSVIEINIKKSKDNRIFLQRRYEEIKSNLEHSEDSLRIYQQKSGIYTAEDQAKSIIEANVNLESELASKQIELAVYEKIFGLDAPQTKSVRISVEEYSKKVNEMKTGSQNNIIIGLKTLPEKAMTYLRLYRNVKIYEAMLEFIIPIYEQTRFEEQKDVPILHIIDYAVPPIKKAYPQRVLSSVIIAFIINICCFLVIILRELLNNSNNDKFSFIKQNLFKFN